MGFSISLRPHIPASYCCGHHCFKFCSLRLHERSKTLSYVNTTARCCALHGINSVLGDRKSSISSNGAPEPPRAVLERLFARTQKLEEQMTGSSHLVEDIQSDFDLGQLEPDLQVILEALRKKEEDLQEAETMVNLEYAELSQARKELGEREKILAAACSKQEKLEEELRQGNLKLVSQARHIEDLKLRLNQRDQDIAMGKFEMSTKEDEIDKLESELMRKNTEALKTEAELKAKDQLLDEAHAVVNKQELELQALQNSLLEKQAQLDELLARQQLEEEKVKAAETKLEQQTMEWLLAQEELKKLGEVVSKYVGESKETMEDFQRVKKLLTDVRSELICSQESLVTSRQKMEERELVLDKQLLELDEQKQVLFSYLNTLKNAQIDVESERAKLKVTEARNKELELDLSLKRDLLQDVREELDKEKTSMQQAIHELSFLREELEKKNIEFAETSSLLEVKEQELVDARLEIQHLKSQHQSIQLVLQERDLELVTARNRLEELNSEVTELRMLLNGKEEQLMLAMNMLKEKEDHAQVIQNELVNAKVKASEAETVVERLVNLTKELVISSQKDELSMSALLSDVGQLPVQLMGKPTEDYRWQKKQLESELHLTRENLKTNEMELLAAQRQLTVKDEELKTIFQSLEDKDAEMKEVKESMLRDGNEFEKLSVYNQGGVDRIHELAIEKLQLEAAQLEVEAATSALAKLVEMSRELLNKATLCIDADLSVNVFPTNGIDSKPRIVESNSFQGGYEYDPDTNLSQNDECPANVKSEVARLAALTEKLVREAGAT